MVSATSAVSATNAVKIEVVAHWHVTESDVGCLPEAEPYTSDSGELALDVLAHLLDDWSNSYDDPEDADSVRAAGLAESFCTCRDRDRERSDTHLDALAAVADGRGICEYIGLRVFELKPCSEKDCLKYCPDAECGTVTPVTEVDTRCWCCGATYVSWEDCDWLA